MRLAPSPKSVTNWLTEEAVAIANRNSSHLCDLIFVQRTQKWVEKVYCARFLCCGLYRMRELLWFVSCAFESCLRCISELLLNCGNALHWMPFSDWTELSWATTVCQVPTADWLSSLQFSSALLGSALLSCSQRLLLVICASVLVFDSICELQANSSKVWLLCNSQTQSAQFVVAVWFGRYNLRPLNSVSVYSNEV